MLLSVRVDSSIAEEAQLHETVMADEMMQMRELESGIQIPAGTNLEFQSGGKHIMLMGLKKPLNASDTFMLTLVFENNKIMRVPVEVKDAR
jgi:copper(I)-binding protein